MPDNHATPQTKKRGRPSLYTVELGRQICARIAGGMGVVAISRTGGMPSAGTIFRWIGEHEEFRNNYVRAGEARGMWRAEQMTATIEDVRSGKLTPQQGAVIINAQQWLASREARKVYGDRVALTGADGGDIRVSHVRDEIQRKFDAIIDADEAEEVPRLSNGSGNGHAKT